MITKVSTKTMSHEEWLEKRRLSIGGSDAGTLLGLNPYSSPYALWTEKTGKVIPEDISDKEAVRLGNDLEQYVADRFTEKTGKKPLMTTFSVYNLARNNEFDCTKARTELGYTTRSYEETIHDEVQWMIAEGLIDGTGVTEKHTVMVNEQIREGGFDVKEAYQNLEDNVVGTYQKIEDGVVGGYRKIEDGAVSGFRRVCDWFIRKLFSRKGETVEETRKRLSGK